MSRLLPVRTLRARTRLASLTGVAASGVGLSALYLATGLGLPCPFRVATGWDCPLCGGTRLGASLLQGDLVAAFFANPLLLVGLGLLTALGLFWTVESLGGPRVRLSGRSTAPLARLRPTSWLAVGLGGTALYIVLRNL